MSLRLKAPAARYAALRLMKTAYAQNADIRHKRHLSNRKNRPSRAVFLLGTFINSKRNGREEDVSEANRPDAVGGKWVKLVCKKKPCAVFR
jgi:hypothetical protein